MDNVHSQEPDRADLPGCHVRTRFVHRVWLRLSRNRTGQRAVVYCFASSFLCFCSYFIYCIVSSVVAFLCARKGRVIDCNAVSVDLNFCYSNLWSGEPNTRRRFIASPCRCECWSNLFCRRSLWLGRPNLSETLSGKTAKSIRLGRTASSFSRRVWK